MIDVEILPRAHEQLRAISQFYAERRSGAGTRFLDELKEIFKLIANYPDSMPRLVANDSRLQGIRVGKLQHFPHLVFYKENNNRVQIIAILHGKQDYYRLLDP